DKEAGQHDTYSGEGPFYHRHLGPLVTLPNASLDHLLSLQLLGSTLIGCSIHPEPLRFLPSPDLEPLLVIAYPKILFHTFVKNLLESNSKEVLPDVLRACAFFAAPAASIQNLSASLRAWTLSCSPPFAIQRLGIPIESGVDELEPEIVGNLVVVAVLLLEIQPDVLG
uniref:Uncharacterized protein n=1 Tax=Oryza nivara TaxID=4536 RepID=A0A0E0INC3_ORYNI